jgi:putative protease
MKEIEVGRVADYFKKIGVVAIDVTAGEIQVGDTLHFSGHTTDFNQKIDSMQIEHESVEKAGKGASIGIKVKERVRIHDHVFKVVED